MTESSREKTEFSIMIQQRMKLVNSSWLNGDYVMVFIFISVGLWLL